MPRRRGARPARVYGRAAADCRDCWAAGRAADFDPRSAGRAFNVGTVAAHVDADRTSACGRAADRVAMAFASDGAAGDCGPEDAAARTG